MLKISIAVLRQASNTSDGAGGGKNKKSPNLGTICKLFEYVFLNALNDARSSARANSVPPNVR